jgi:hypothetical protein
MLLLQSNIEYRVTFLKAASDDFPAQRLGIDVGFMVDTMALGQYSFLFSMHQQPYVQQFTLRFFDTQSFDQLNKHLGNIATFRCILRYTSRRIDVSEEPVMSVFILEKVLQAD